MEAGAALTDRPGRSLRPLVDRLGADERRAWCVGVHMNQRMPELGAARGPERGPADWLRTPTRPPS